MLAALGALGLIAGGVARARVELAAPADCDRPGADRARARSPLVAFYFVTRKVIAAHRDEPVRTGTEEMIGSTRRGPQHLDPEGQVWAGGTVWRARLADGAEAPVATGG